MKDIAMLAGVSKQAVSVALNGNGSSRVSAEKREKIQKLAKELNYVPNAAARSLSGSETRTIGLMGSISGTHPGILISEICETLIARGYNTLLSQYNWTNYQATSALSELVSRGVDGVIIMDSANRAELEKGQKVPFVYCSHDWPANDDVGTDDEQIGYLATNHLLDHGHRRVFYVSPMASFHKKRRITGWERAQQERGIAVTDDMLINLRDLNGQTDLLLERLKCSGVTALLCSNDYVGAKILKALWERGVRIPEDIAIVGCDGLSLTEFCPVSLTTVIQSVRQVAEASVDLLLERIRKKELHAPAAGIQIQPVLHCGGSCGCPQPMISQLYRINSTGSLEKDMMINFNQNILE